MDTLDVLLSKLIDSIIMHRFRASRIAQVVEESKHRVAFWHLPFRLYSLAAECPSFGTWT
jgi:hypothetical protein